MMSLSENLSPLGIGTTIAVVLAGVVIYINRMKEKIKGFVLRRKEIEKFLKD